MFCVLSNPCEPTWLSNGSLLSHHTWLFFLLCSLIFCVLPKPLIITFFFFTLGLGLVSLFFFSPLFSFLFPLGFGVWFLFSLSLSSLFIDFLGLCSLSLFFFFFFFLTLYELHRVICCGVEGIGGVNGQICVDGFDFLWFAWWWMENYGGLNFLGLWLVDLWVGGGRRRGGWVFFSWVLGLSGWGWSWFKLHDLVSLGIGGWRKKKSNNNVKRIEEVSFSTWVVVQFPLHQVNPWVPQKVEIFKFSKWKLNQV